MIIHISLVHNSTTVSGEHTATSPLSCSIAIYGASWHAFMAFPLWVYCSTFCFGECRSFILSCCDLGMLNCALIDGGCGSKASLTHYITDRPSFKQLSMLRCLQGILLRLPDATSRYLSAAVVLNVSCHPVTCAGWTSVSFQDERYPCRKNDLA